MPTYYGVFYTDVLSDIRHHVQTSDLETAKSLYIILMKCNPLVENIKVFTKLGEFDFCTPVRIDQTWELES